MHGVKLSCNKSAEIVSRKNVQKSINLPGIIDDTLLNLPVILQVPIESCPIGFSITTSPPYVCTCHTKLVGMGLHACEIVNHTGWIYRMGTIWISSSFSPNETNSFVGHPYCPYNYCKTDNVSVSLESPDTQCALNRAGVLCGGCRANYSLALGTSKCLPCDNNNISLLIFFCVAGILLVLLIKLLDFTVSNGPINGLILYTNIIWVNKTILVKHFEDTKFLHITMAWLNLDFGIETCFFNGFNGYWKMWLQFVFPVYVWFITIAIIVASHYSSRASRLFGNNSVPVLATLILLSYTKLLRTIITTFGFTVIDYPQNQTVVWSFDGNIPYFGTAHAFLFITALAVLLLWLPFTAILFTHQWLKRKSNLKLLRWINRLKPFFDAYLGQLKPTKQYWFGLLLLVRVFLLVLFAVTSTLLPRINILAVAVLGLFLFIHNAMFGLAYKSLWLSILELSFIMNLTVLAIVSLYLPSNTKEAKVTVVFISVTIAFLKFIGIVVYHIYIQGKTTYNKYKRNKMRQERVTNTAGREMNVLIPAHHGQMQYREPLLESALHT